MGWTAFLRMSLRLSFAGVALALLSACGPDAPPRPFVRLTELEGRLDSPAEGERSLVLAEDFASLAPDWRVVTDMTRPLDVDPDALRATTGRERDLAFLTLSGTGSLVRIVPVEGDATYEFRGRMRARGVVPGAGSFHGTTLWLGEMGAGTPEELLRDGQGVRKRHTVAGAAGHDGWQDVRMVFRTRPDTRSLIVAAVLALGGEQAEGEVDFAALRLEGVPDRVYWDHLTSESATGTATERVGTAWRTRRALSAMVAAEARPAIALLPGEELHLAARVPSGAPRLELALAPWPRDLRPGQGPLEFRVEVDGREVLRQRLEVPARACDATWVDADVDLARWAGDEVDLELALAGPQPGLFASACLVDASRSTTAPSVVLISIDTLRADHVGAYGYDAGTTPRIDRLASESLLFEDATAQAPYTLPSHATLFTGQFPSVHGVEDQGRLLSPRRSPVLATLLADSGYRTQAFTAGGFLTPDFGFDAGFDGFAIVDPFRHAGSSYYASLPRLLPTQVPQGVAPEPGAAVERWLERHAKEPFFLFLHTFQVHEYDAPPGTLDCERQGCAAPEVDFHRFTLTPRRREAFAPSDETRHLAHLYDGALRGVDASIARVLDQLEHLGIADRTIVVVTSDHGEEHFERGHLQHGKTVYEELTRVPLVIHVPGRAPARIATPVQLADVAPTLLAALGLPHDPRMQGHDLLRPLTERPVWCEVDDGLAHRSALRGADGWKLIHSPLDPELVYPPAREWELFHLPGDPGERDDRTAAEPERFEALRRELSEMEERLARVRATLGEMEESGASEETLQQLHDLGYGGE